MLTFYVVRHGSTEHNRKGVVMGQIDTPLTEEGLQNAEVLAGKLHNIHFDHVYSSDLGRAFITAHIIVERLGVERKLTRAKELREINYGIYANLKEEEVRRECPQYKQDIHFVYPEGESASEMQHRASSFIKHLESKHPHQTILIVTHSGVIRALKCYFNEWNFQDHLHMKITHEYVGKFVIDNHKLVSYEKINE